MKTHNNVKGGHFSYQYKRLEKGEKHSIMKQKLLCKRQFTMESAASKSECLHPGKKIDPVVSSFVRLGNKSCKIVKKNCS